MNKFLCFAILNLLFSLSLSKAQTVTLSNTGLGQSSVYTFNYTTTGAIGKGTDVPNVFYFTIPAGYQSISPVLAGGNTLQPYVTFKVNGTAYPCTMAFGGVGGSWASGVQLSVAGATTGVAIPAGAQIQVIISGLIKNPLNAGAYTVSWRTLKASGVTVENFSAPLNFSATLGTQEAIIKNTDLSVYPNPADSFIQVAGSVTNGKYTIYDVSGNQMSKGTVAANEKINVSNLASGVYVLKFENGKTAKFIKK
ncbi:hypothetical protein M2347_001725 [Chryseobacterium sp. H1D6B]|uniref:T9SS type A sorting domain-containing protein n=1 Tax=Chryseobacterium sp. H1D6B TaxID=2940588 RepID=UPI0015CCB3EF|nr:T9SS type A sorting domain-containing protein [Chryseobacterium sp. H1D6B]MDH6251998.1 hypothetical protein [Chryseobacterium sp. H1D6B]